jgi:hypothetical protein
MSSEGDSGVQIRLNMGWGRIDRVKKCEVRTSKGPEGNHATVQIETSDLSGSDLSYVGEAFLEELRDSTERRLITGIVDTVTINDDSATISIVGSHQEFREIRMGKIIFSPDVPPQELIYGILRSSGWPYGRSQLVNWSPGPDESFLVATPIAGATLSRQRTIGRVSITPNNPCDVAVEESEIRDAFFGAGSWAVTLATAKTLFDGEVRGLEQIDWGISVVRALSSFRFPMLQGKCKPYSRAQARAKLRTGSVVYVKSVATGRQWLRSIGVQESIDLLDIDNIVPEAIPESQDSGSEQMLNRSVREWKAAADSIVDYERVAHLWRSIECYANHCSSSPLFKGADLKAIRSSILNSGSWEEHQKDRLLGVVGMLNDLPLLEKFKIALELDGVEVSSNGWELIRKTRPLRNNLEHGRLLSEPEHRLLDGAIAFMNYVLVSVMVS